MKTKIKIKNSFTRQLSIVVEWKDLKSDFDKKFESVKSNYTPAGGRKGKVQGMALDLFKKNYTASIEAQFAEDSISKYYQEGVKELDIVPINQGKIIDMKFKSEQNLELEIEFEIKPEFKLPKYDKKFKVTAAKYISSKKDLEDAIADLQNSHSTMKEINAGAKEGDFLMVDMQEYENGNPIVGKKMEKQYIKLGGGVFQKKTLKALEGIKKNEKRNTIIDINGKKVDYEFLVHKVEEQILPELNDTFAKKADPDVKTLSELKKKINDNIEQSFENEYVKTVNNAIIDYFIAKTKIEAPDSMVANYIEHLVQNNKSKQPQMTEAQEEEMRKTSHEGAIFNVKWYLIKDKIVHDAKLNVSKEDMTNKEAELVEKDPANAKQIKAFLKNPENQQRFFDDMLSEKLFMYLKGFAVIKVDKKKSDELRKMQGVS